MRREIPDDADVRLVETEIHAARRDEVEIAQLARLDQVRWIGNDRRAVEEGVSRHQHQPATLASRIRSSRHSPDEAASGFSTNTCLPASSAARPSGKCVDTGVAIATASTVASARTSSKLGRAGTAGNRRSDQFDEALASRSQTTTDLGAIRARGGCGRGSGPSTRDRRRRLATSGRGDLTAVEGRAPLTEERERRAQEELGGRGRATSHARRRRPSRAPRRTSSLLGPSPARDR